MKVLKHNESLEVVRLWKESEGLRSLEGWIGYSSFDMGDTIFEESEIKFPDGLTYDEAFSFLEGK